MHALSIMLRMHLSDPALIVFVDRGPHNLVNCKLFFGRFRLFCGYLFALGTLISRLHVFISLIEPILFAKICLQHHSLLLLRNLF